MSASQYIRKTLSWLFVLSICIGVAACGEKAPMCGFSEDVIVDDYCAASEAACESKLSEEFAAALAKQCTVPPCTASLAWATCIDAGATCDLADGGSGRMFDVTRHVRCQ